MKRLIISVIEVEAEPDEMRAALQEVVDDQTTLLGRLDQVRAASTSTPPVKLSFLAITEAIRAFLPGSHKISPFQE